MTASRVTACCWLEHNETGVEATLIQRNIVCFAYAGRVAFDDEILTLATCYGKQTVSVGLFMW